MEHGWYQDSVSKVLDPETGEVLNRYISPKVMEKYFRAGTPYVNQNWGLAYIGKGREVQPQDSPAESRCWCDRRTGPVAAP